MYQRLICSTLLGITLLLALIAGAISVTLHSAAAEIPDHYIVVLHPDVNDTAAIVSDMAQRHGLAMGHIYKYALKGFSAVIPAAALDAIRHDPRVSFVEQDHMVQAFAQTIPTGINRIDADLNPTASIDGIDQRVNVDIAIIDTGIQLNHPDLYVFAQKTFVTGTSTADDDNGHGTHVAGTAAAIDNGIGVVGVSPGARLWAVKVLDRNGGGSLSDVIAGIDYVTLHANEIDVANMSLGCNCQSSAGDTALANSVAAGVTYSVAAGNSGADASGFWPASNPNVIAVSAIADSDGKCGGLGSVTSYGKDDAFASFSNYGSVVDLAAPGVDILSTYKGSSYATMSGTSMASPHVAGSAALYVASSPNYPTNRPSPSEVKSRLVSSAVAQTKTCDTSLNNGNGGFNGDPSPEPLVYNGVASPDFSISASTSSLSIKAGSSDSSTKITIGSLNGFTGTVSLVATSSVTGITASLSAPSVQITSSGSSNSSTILTVGAAANITLGTYVNAVTITGTSGSLSHSTSVTVIVPTVPSAPQNLIATSGNAQITLSWSAPPSDGGSAITGYNIYRGTRAAGETLLSTIGNVLTYTDTTVTNELTYYYHVTAINSAGESSASNEAFAKPSASVPTLTVKSISTSTLVSGVSGNKKINTQVSVVDKSTNNGIQGATVSIIVTLPSGATLNGSGITDSTGKVIISIGPTKEKGAYTSCVNNIVSSGWAFDGIKPCATGTL